MTNQELKHLKELIITPSPSGFENVIARYLKDKLREHILEEDVEIDFQQNVIAKIEGEDTSKTIVIDAHLDQIGFVVTNIDKEGLISIDHIGGHDSTIVSARPLNIITDAGVINAVVDRKHAHLVYDEEDESIFDISNAQIDIGVRKQEEVSKFVKIGDPVVYKPHFYKLLKKYYSGYGFDDKAGCWILLNAIKKMASKPPVNLVFVFSSQEETGTKLFSVIRKVKPSLVISVDVTFATDYGHDEELNRQAGTCNLNGGPVIYRGLGLDKKCYELMEGIATKNKIPFQTQANSDAGGFTSLMVSDELCGIKAMVLGIPLRNMHTPVEIICLDDLDKSAKLLINFLMDSNIKNVI